MSAPAFTPGPWHYRPNEYDDWGYVRATPESADRLGGIICQARDPKVLDEEQLSPYRRIKTDPWEANARLIAAAPDLYDALNQVVATSPIEDSVLPIVLAALAKADGGPQ